MGRHDVTMTYIALMANNGFIHARRGIISSQEIIQACRSA